MHIGSQEPANVGICESSDSSALPASAAPHLFASRGKDEHIQSFESLPVASTGPVLRALGIKKYLNFWDIAEKNQKHKRSSFSVAS